MKYLIGIIILASSFSLNAQETGTFKVTKKVDIEADQRRRPRFHSASDFVFAGKSSPKLIRNIDFKLGIGYPLGKRHSSAIVSGLTIGNANPNIEYKGMTVGAYARYSYALYLGPTAVIFPFQFQYKKLFNSLSGQDLNQFLFSTGLSFRITLPGRRMKTDTNFLLHFSGNYIIDKNEFNSTSGFFPGVSLDYYF